jgi:hypothetical protein
MSPGGIPGRGRARARARAAARLLLGAGWVERLSWLARATRGPVTIGANLAAGDPRRALGFARAVRAALPRGALRTLEIGNEPDLYTRGVTFRAGRVLLRRVARRARYGQARYEADVRRYVATLSPGLGRAEAVRGTPAPTCS